MDYFLLFMVFSIIGFFIDSAYRSIVDRKITYGTLIPLFSPLYGISGVTLVFIFRNLIFAPIILIMIGALSAVIIEFIAGLFCTHILKKRLWDYSASRFNIYGHIDLLHSFYWLMLSTLLYLLTPFLFM